MKFLKKSMIVKKIEENEALELKKVYNRYLDKRKKIIKNTQFEIQDIFSDTINNDNISQDQVTKPNNFLRKYCEYEQKDQFNFLQAQQKKYTDIQRSALPENNF